MFITWCSDLRPTVDTVNTGKHSPQFSGEVLTLSSKHSPVHGPIYPELFFDNVVKCREGREIKPFKESPKGYG